VVLLEDFAAVLGLTIAATCISITHYTGIPLPDAVGSLLIGTLLGGVASFIIYTNTMSLVGRSSAFVQSCDNCDFVVTMKFQQYDLALHLDIVCDCCCHTAVFRSIPLEKKQELMLELENDRMIR